MKSAVGSSGVGRVWVGRLPAVGQLVVVTREATATTAAVAAEAGGGGAPLVVGGREGRHLLVRRPRPGEAVQLFDGRGALATATVVQASRHQATLRVLSSSPSTTTSSSSTSASTRSEQHSDGEDDDNYGDDEEKELESLRAATRGEEYNNGTEGEGPQQGDKEEKEKEKEEGQGQGQRRLTVAVAMPKGSRADWVVEKLTEVGAHRVQPLLATKSVLLPGDGRLQRWRQMARTALPPQHDTQHDRVA